MQNDLRWTYYNSYFVTATVYVCRLQVSVFSFRIEALIYFITKLRRLLIKFFAFALFVHGYSFHLYCLGNSFIQNLTNLLACEQAFWALWPQSSLKSLVAGCKFKISKHDLVVKFARLT